MEKEGAELAQMRSNPHRDYYNCRKVDTHIHLAAAMNQKHLLRFIKRKMKVEPDTPVIAKNGRTLTLRDVCAELRLSPYDINLDSLGMHADSSTFRRFDKFNLKYNPLGDASLREIFIKTDNYVNGRYLAELTKELFADLEESKYVNTEYRLSIYGRKPDEWTGLADWVCTNKLWSPNNRWLIQVKASLVDCNNAHARTRTHTHTRAHTHTHTHARTHAHTRTHAHARTHTHTRTRTRTRTHT
jgi:AMP deaminase